MNSKPTTALIDSFDRPFLRSLPMSAGLSNAKGSSSQIRTRSNPWRVYSSRPFSSRSSMFVSLLSVALLLTTLACRTDSESQGVRPRQLRDVPARRLAFNFQADIQPDAGLIADEVKTIIPAI